jgi:hypothetical protein
MTALGVAIASAISPNAAKQSGAASTGDDAGELLDGHICMIAHT